MSTYEKLFLVVVHYGIVAVFALVVSKLQFAGLLLCLYPITRFLWIPKTQLLKRSTIGARNQKHPLITE